MDLVSIIVPVYNSEDTIKKTITSLTKQTYKNIEIIIINDGSSDKSLEIINSIKENDDRVLIINQENSGVSIARNNGIAKSSGQYIMFIDSDDWVEQSFVEKMVKTIKDQKVDAVRCNYFKENKNNTEISKLYDLSNKKFIKGQKEYINIYNHFLYYKEPINNYVMLLIIKSQIIKNKISFDENLYMMEDVYFYQQILTSIESIYFLNEPLYHYNNYNISTTRDVKKVEKNIYGIMQSSKKIIKHLKNNKIQISEKRINSNQLNLIIHYLNKINENYNELQNILFNLYKNDNFNNLISNYDPRDLSPYRKIIVLLLKNHNIKITTFLFKIRNIIKKTI